MKERLPETERMAGLKLLFAKFRGQAWVTVGELYDEAPPQLATSQLEVMRLLDLLKSQGLAQQNPLSPVQWRLPPTLLDALAQASVTAEDAAEAMIDVSVAEGAVAHFEWLMKQGALTPEEAPHLDNLIRLAKSYRKLREPK